MKTRVINQESRLGILLPKHIKDDAPGVAAAIPKSGIAIREVVESYQFKHFGGGGVRSRFEFVNVAPAVSADIIKQLRAWLDSFGSRPGQTLDADDISHALRGDLLAGLFPKE